MAKQGRMLVKKRVTLIRLARWRTSNKQWNAVLGLRRVMSEFGDKLLSILCKKIAEHVI